MMDMMEKIHKSLASRRLLFTADATGYMNPVTNLCIYSFTTGGYSLGRLDEHSSFVEPLSPQELPQAMRELAAALLAAADEIDRLLAEAGEE